MKKKIVKIIMIAGLFLSAVASAEEQAVDLIYTGAGAVTYDEFRASVNRAVKMTMATVNIPISVFSSPRKSNKYLYNAMEEIEANRDYEKARRYLHAAIDKNRNNFLAYLIMAIVWDLEKQNDAANPYYLEFLNKSVGSSPMEDGLVIDPQDIMIMRLYVRNLLADRGVDINGKPARKGTARLGSSPMIWFTDASDTLKMAYDLIFLLLIIAGIFYFFFRSALGLPHNEKRDRIVFSLTGALLAAGLIEMIHYAIQLPFLVSKYFERTALVVCIILVSYISAEVRYKRYVKTLLEDPRARLCPKCNRVIQKISTECPYCRARL
jgi:tetratricopeptide (TPR) repeat protein